MKQRELNGWDNCEIQANVEGPRGLAGLPVFRVLAFDFANIAWFAGDPWCRRHRGMAHRFSMLQRNARAMATPSASDCVDAM